MVTVGINYHQNAEKYHFSDAKWAENNSK